MGFSVPVFVVGLPADLHLRHQPEMAAGAGLHADRGRPAALDAHLVLPAFALGMAYVALIARITRTTMLDVLAEDYMRTAKAKGVAAAPMLFEARAEERAVPIVTVVGNGVGAADRRCGDHRDGVSTSPALGGWWWTPSRGATTRSSRAVIMVFSGSMCWSICWWTFPTTLFDPRIRG